MSTQTDTRPRGASEMTQLGGRNTGLVATVVVLALAVVGLGAWMLWGTTDVAVSSEIQPVVDDYIAAWNAYDGDAFLAVVTDDYTFESDGQITNAADEAMLIDLLGTYNWKVEEVGDPIMVGNASAYVVAIPERVTIASDDSDGISVLTIVQQDGEYLVSHHVFTEATP